MLTRAAAAIAISLAAVAAAATTNHVAKAEEGDVEPTGFLPKKTTVTITNMLEN
ncbi:unnamed protein product [Linum tenue]|uniref:Uncharacterized protein n=1 Tax=Linum tenue TaxID=586396 RepID=A0AAV0H554_9ROSI|nr:unnamed protein product [Linum tenue]